MTGIDWVIAAAVVLLALLGWANGFLSGALSLLGVAWLVGAIALVNGGRDIREAVQKSAVLSALNSVLPPSGPLLNALARFDPLPAFAGPQVNVAPPRAAIARDPEVEAARRSVVKILGTACGVGIEGSGWVADAGTVVTNAHVVAGQDD